MLLVVISVINVSAVARFVLRPGADCRSRLPITTADSPFPTYKLQTAHFRTQTQSGRCRQELCGHRPTSACTPRTSHLARFAARTPYVDLILLPSLFSLLPHARRSWALLFLFLFCCAVLCCALCAMLCFVLFCFVFVQFGIFSMPPAWPATHRFRAKCKIAYSLLTLYGNIRVKDLY